MSKKIQIILSVLVISCGIGFFHSSSGAPDLAIAGAKRTVWEYKSVSLIGIKDEDAVLNKFGADGWELESVYMHNRSQRAYFKRVKLP